MQSRVLNPLHHLVWVPAAAAGLFAVWLTLEGSAAAAIALFVLIGALGVVILRPVPALALLVFTRFSFEMFWEQRVYGFSVLDFLGAGVPVAVLVSIFLARPRFSHVPLARPILAWATIVWISAAVYIAVGGETLPVVENALRYTCGVPIFLLTVMVVPDFEKAWKLLRLWLLGAVPVAAIFYGYGERLAMEYHGVVRMKAFYHDVVTPAVVGCMSMLIALFLLGLGWMRRWRPHWILLLLLASGLFGRLVYLTFHNALAGVAFLGVATFFFLRRRFGLLACLLVLLVGLTQVERVQQRWWREIAILEGDQDPVAFASGRPNQWRFYLGRFLELGRMDQCLGVHGTWGDPENQFLQLLGDLGPVVGLYTLGIVLWILWTVYGWARQEVDPERKLFFHFAVAVLVGSGAAWITATPLTYSNFQWFLFCLVGLAVAVRLDSERIADEAVPEARVAEGDSVNGLRQRVLHGLLWRSSVGGGQQILQILFTVLLARLLTTGDFGLVAMALAVTRLAQAVSSVQFGASLVRDKDSTDGQASAILLCQVGINLVMSIACCLAAPLAAAFFRAPLLEPIVTVLAWSLLVSSFAFPQIILRKRMEFGAYSALEIASMIVANVVAVAAAFGGMGVWSLVIRLMTDRVVFAAGVWWISGWRPVRPDFRGVGQHLRMGLHLLGSNILYYVSQNLAVILIGRFAGQALLGCFNIAFMIAVAPAAQVQAILTTVLQPAFAFFQGDPPAFRKKAFTSMFALGLVYIPALLGLAAVARPLILFAYGAQWEPAAFFLVPLAGVGLVKGLEHLLRSVIIAAGRSSAILRITAIETLVAVLFLAIGGGLGGAKGLAIAYFASALAAGALTLREANAAVGGGVFLRAISRSLLAAGAMAAVVAAAAAVMPWPHGATLLIQVLLGTCLYLILRLRTLTAEERTLVRTLPVAGLVLARRQT